MFSSPKGFLRPKYLDVFFAQSFPAGVASVNEPEEDECLHLHANVKAHENTQLASAMFFETWVPWGDAGFALCASGRRRWLLLGG